MRLRPTLPALAAALALMACSSGPAAGEQIQASADKPFTQTVLGAFNSPWAFNFLPGGKMLVTEKTGPLILFDPATGKKQTVSGTPPVISVSQAAMMDVVPAPDFATSNIIYLSYSEPGEGKQSGLALATARLVQGDAPSLADFKVIFCGTPFVESGGHYSGRIAFSPDNKYLFLSSGDRQKLDPAQDPQALLGKVLRLNLDGTPAADNPLAAKGFHPAIWSYGHRNLLGIAFDKDGRLWEMEMGPRHGDEINLVKPGLNYGWPKASFGNHYDGRSIPDHKPGDGFEPPKVYWDPAISPGGLAYYDGALFPAWRNSLFITGLSGQSLDRISLNGENATKADHWDMGARIRGVRTGPDGAVYLIEDGEGGRLLKLTPPA